MKKSSSLKRQPLYDISLVITTITCAYILQLIYAGQFDQATQRNIQLSQEVALKSTLVQTGDVEGILNTMEEYVPKGIQRSSLTRTISQWATNITVQLVGIDFTEAPREQTSTEEGVTDESLILFESTAKREVVQIQIRGTEQSVLSFLQQLENSPRLIDVITVSYSGDETTTDVVGSIEAYIYYQ